MPPKKIFWALGSMCGRQTLRRPTVAAVSGIKSDTQKRSENSTVPQGSQGTGYASPMAALTAFMDKVYTLWTVGFPACH